MRPHPRIRKTVKWGGVAVCIAIVISWFYSINHDARYIGFQARGIELSHGQVGVGRWEMGGGPVPRGLRIVEEPHQLFWNFDYHEAPIVESYTIPLWAPFIAVAIATALAWRLDTRARKLKGLHCPTCNYDRTGLALNAYCPECGAQPLHAPN